MDKLQPFDAQQLEAACKILADTERGLTGTEIGYILEDCKVADVSPSMTKWKRLFNALTEAQNKHHVGNHLIMFVNRALNPVRYVHKSIKGIGERIRRISDLSSDGAELVNSAFSVKSPILMLNPLSNDTELSEQKGFSNMLVGLFGAVRNPTAHAPKLLWTMTEQDALDVFSMVSFFHRKLDNAKKIEPRSN
ncbi:MAG: TIGR02391 family protein [Candidatus Electrothrix sp. AUS3]|nr:TIGR02391 family protein [Candidatus Electrothrix gigas]